MVVAVGLPAVFGAADFGLAASTGVLSALYFAEVPVRTRAIRLPWLQAAFLAACAMGAMTAAAPGTVAPALTAVDLVAAVGCVGLGVGPPAALFFVLGPGIVASQVAAGASVSGTLTAVTVGIAAGYLSAVSPLVSRRARARRTASPEAMVRFALDPDRRKVLARLVPAIVLAAVASALLGLDRPYWAQMAVVSILQAAPHRRTGAVRAVQRAAGTVLGAVVAVGLAAVSPSGLPLAMLLAVLLFGTEVAIARHYGLAMLFVTPLALTAAAAGDDNPIGDAIARVADTALGAGLALSVLVVEILIVRLAARMPGHEGAPL